MSRRSIGEAGRRAFYDALQGLLRIDQFRDRDRACYGTITPNECYALETVERAERLSVCGLAAALGSREAGDVT